MGVGALCARPYVVQAFGAMQRIFEHLQLLQLLPLA